MRTLKRLFYVACTAFLLTSCEETYNDKLFWPGELCQEYGSYIKPATLNLTYSGGRNSLEKLSTLKQKTVKKEP